MSKMSFEKFWSRLLGLSPVDLPRGQVAMADAKGLTVNHSGKSSPFRCSKSKCQEYFDACTGGKRAKSGYFNSVYKVVTSRPTGPMKSTVLLEDAQSVPPAINSAAATRSSSQSACRCQLCRDFVLVLAQRYGFCLISKRAFPGKWVKWTLKGAQISLARLGNRVARLTAAQKAVCVQQLTLLLNAVPRNAVQFRKLRKQIIDALTKNGLTIGEAQKLVNLASKYLYAYYYAEIDRPWMANHHWINSIAGEMHVPIDSIVLESLHGKYPKMMLCLPTGIGADRIQCPHAGNVWTWSQLDCAVCYRQIQVFCRKQAHREGYIDAVEFEMAQLWR